MVGRTRYIKIFISTQQIYLILYIYYIPNYLLFTRVNKKIITKYIYKVGPIFNLFVVYLRDPLRYYYINYPKSNRLNLTIIFIDNRFLDR